jgi:thiamine biosynthesis lipoprotein
MNFKKIGVLLLLLLIINGCKEKIEIRDFTFKGPVFGTSYKITYLNATKNYKKSIDSLFLAVNNSLSTYIPSSDISRINKGDKSIKIDDLFTEVFLKSKRIYKETDGFFDPTVGNLVNAYGFGPKDEMRNLSDAEVFDYMQFVGLNKVDLQNGYIIKTHPNIFLDFNSIAKGFGIDVIARFFDKKNIDSYLIEIGGEIRAKGRKKNNQPWVIKLVDPVDVNTGYKVINLSDKSMATSGNYRKFRVAEDGTKFVHTVNPKTGFARESNLLSASVISKKDCADVDAYATAFMAMGFEKTKSFINKNKDLKVILIYIDANDNLKEYTNYTYN